MNLTGQPVYQKGTSRRSAGKARPANAAERRHWARIRALGCILNTIDCHGRPTTHHCGTGAGGRKDHMKVICLCYHHHLGAEGIDSLCIPKPYSKRTWQDKYGSEQELMAKTAQWLLHGKT